MLVLSNIQNDTIHTLKNEQSYVFDVNSQHFLALMLNNSLFIYQNLCPHLNKRIANDSFHCFDETFSLIECQFHGAQFTPEKGECVSGPCLGERLQRFIITEVDNVFCLLPTSNELKQRT
ncbi:Rieske (2Fe-2S) protein [Marinomonas gallaica]|uniref:Rieske (2Fe-2S) protein n=1 Tax=Marinomonas gallaica TaxID=1806667 RepID=UPI003A94E1B8